MPKPRLAARALKPVLAGLEALGHPADRVLAECGLPAHAPADPDARLPDGAMGRLWDRAVALTGDDLIGMHVALAAPIGAFDMHAYAMLSSRSLADAYQRACRYQALLNEATELTFSTGRAEGVLRHALIGGHAVPRQPAEFLVTAWLRLGRLVTGTEWTPTRVCFAHDRPADAREHERTLGAPIQFACGRTAMHVPTTALDLANPRADDALVALLDRYAASLLGRRPPAPGASARVRAWLVEAHAAGAPAASRAAKSLAMSVRTLHRRLADEGTTFRQVLDQFRHEQAVELLAADRHSVADVAFLLGYSELSAFYRAFRRWTGKTPRSLPS